MRVFKIEFSFWHGVTGCISVVNCFHKKFYLRCLIAFWICIWLSQYGIATIKISIALFRDVLKGSLFTYSVVTRILEKRSSWKKLWQNQVSIFQKCVKTHEQMKYFPEQNFNIWRLWRFVSSICLITIILKALFQKNHYYYTAKIASLQSFYLDQFILKGLYQ